METYFIIIVPYAGKIQIFKVLDSIKKTNFFIRGSTFNVMKLIPNLVKIFKKNLSAGKEIDKNFCTSETIRTNSNFDFWLAGLIDGDGSISISKQGHVSCEVVLHKKEISALYYIKSVLGGSVSQKTENSYRWRLHNKAGITNLINRINGKLLTESKKLRLIAVCKLESYPILVKDSFTDLSTNSWFCGFFDAEGSINYNTKNNQPNLSVSQKTRDVLDKICKQFNGNVYYDKSWNGYIYYISQTGDLENLFKYFNEFKLKTKHLDLFHLKKLMNMKTLYYHLPNSEHHSEFLKTLEHLKNRK